MSSKRFDSPAALAGSRYGAQRGALGNSVPTRYMTTSGGAKERAEAPTGAARRVSRRRQPLSPAASHMRTTSPETSVGARSYTPTSISVGRTGRGGSAGRVHSMLSDLVHLSQSIASYLEQEPGPSLAGSTAERAGASLKAQEIERIVNRVQAHFKTKVEALERENAALKRELAAARAQEDHCGPQHSNASPSVRRAIEAEEEALDALGRTWSNGDAQANPDVEQLRRVLLAEKRQRLLVEEQTQSLTEQHAKVVSTLERRLQKQEDQLRDLISAVDRTYNGGAASLSRSPGPSSPTTTTSTNGGQVTPRRLLRQQLAQHQQTQRALQQYRAHLIPATRPDAHAAAGDDGDLASLQLPGVQATLRALQLSTPPTVTGTQEEAQLSSALTATASPSASMAEATESPTTIPPRLPPPQPRASESPKRSGSAVDDIGAYLDSITKELEGLGGDEDFL